MSGSKCHYSPGLFMLLPGFSACYPVLVIALFMIFAESTMAIGMLDPMLEEIDFVSSVLDLCSSCNLYNDFATGIISEIIPTFHKNHL